jgi:Radical SAM superfamily
VRRISAADIARARSTPGDTVLLFLTDRCPVNCRHCSVDSRPDSPMITDRELFAEVVGALCASGYWLVGISGGEPFVERKGLTHAVGELTAAGKAISIVTSGVWATSPAPPQWIRSVIGRCGSLVLSSDTFHSDALADGRFRNAARAIAREGVWIIVQAIGQPEMVENAERQLADAFGGSWRDDAELMLSPMLPYGRAEDIFQISSRHLASDFGPCRLVRSPVVRYDGVISGCCNESVLMGKGPATLRRRGHDRQSVAAGLKALERHAFLRAMGGAGPGPLTADPRLADLEGGRYGSICDVCWAMIDRIGDGANDGVFLAVAELTSAASHVT